VCEGEGEQKYHCWLKSHLHSKVEVLSYAGHQIPWPVGVLTETILNLTLRTEGERETRERETGRGGARGDIKRN
jgi:hypothetical protein